MQQQQQHNPRPTTPARTSPRRATTRTTIAASLCCGLLALAALSGLMSVNAASASPAQSAHAAASPLHYQRGYSVQRDWLCLGYSDGAYHCTQHWYRASDGRYVSLNPAWVSSQGSAAPSVLSATTVSYSVAPRSISQWAYTGRASYNDSGLRGPYATGNCTLYAWSRDTRLSGLGNAGNWARAARARGFAVSTAPRVGATVVFAGGVEGASGLGHVAHVEQVYANGWFLISEMNFSWNGGGWGRVDYRYARSGPGVSFIL